MQRSYLLIVEVYETLRARLFSVALPVVAAHQHTLRIKVSKCMAQSELVEHRLCLCEPTVDKS